MKEYLNRCLAVFLVLVVCGSLLITPTHAEPKFDTVQYEMSPLAKTAPLMLESIRTNNCMDDETIIKSTIELFLHLKIDQIVNWMYDDFDYYPFFNKQSDYYQTIISITEKNRAVKRCWRENSVNILWSNIDITYEQVECFDESATVSLYETFEFIEESNHVISSMGMHYYFQMSKIEEKWLISAVLTSDDPNYKTNYPEFFQNEHGIAEQHEQHNEIFPAMTEIDE